MRTTTFQKRMLTLTMLLGLPAAGWSNQDGTDTALFLNLGQGARAEGMGGAFTAVADDSYATYWNPAGLARVTNQRLAFNHMSYIEDINSQFAAYAMPVPKARGTLGFSLSYVNFGTIDRRDSNGVAESGDSEVKAMAGGVSWGQVISKAASFGFGVKSFSQNLAGNKVSGFAGDAGLFVAALPDRLHIGAAVSNIGPKISVGSTDEDLPMTMRGGVAFYPIPQQWVVDADVSKARSSEARMHLGTEYVYQNTFVLRGGYQDTKEAGGGLSFGAGFIWQPRGDGNYDFFGQRRPTLGKRQNVSEESSRDSQGFEVRFDYAYVDYGDFDTTHRIGVELSF